MQSMYLYIIIFLTLLLDFQLQQSKDKKENFLRLEHMNFLKLEFMLIKAYTINLYLVILSK